MRQAALARAGKEKASDMSTPTKKSRGPQSQFSRARNQDAGSPEKNPKLLSDLPGLSQLRIGSILMYTLWNLNSCGMADCFS